MKGGNEEAMMSSQIKKHNGNRSDPPTQAYLTPAAAPAAASEATASGGSRLTTNDALAYLKKVKDVLQDRREKYEEFLEVMRDFKSQRIDTAGVIRRVKELFEGHRDLILGFNTFLPKGFEIKLPPEEKKTQVEFQQAIKYVNKIKSRFQHEEHVYKKFLEILNTYRKENKTIPHVKEEVAVLFKDHLDLLEEFNCFLPEKHVSPTTIPSGWNFVPNQNERSPAIPRHVPGEKADLDQERHKRRVEKEKEWKEGNNTMDPEWAEREIEHDIKNAYNGPQKRKFSTRKMEDGVVDQMHKSGESGYPGAHNVAALSQDDNSCLKSAYRQEFSFAEKVKQKLHSESYQEFLKCLHIYSEEIITRNELTNLVNDILGKFPDLMDGFQEFLNRCENVDGFLAGVINTRQPSRPVKLGEKEKGKECEKDDKEKDRIKERQKERDKSDKAAQFPSKEAACNKELFCGKDKSNMYKPISELDLSNCDRCTPSYRLLPKHYSVPSASYVTSLAASVLNDVWVSVTSGSEDYSFKHMRKNQYEESLFRCEDDRFELDMLLESVSMTARSVEELIEMMQNGSAKIEMPIRIEDHLTSLNIRCIERLYGDHGLDVVEILRKNAGVALPVILMRLKQKHEEWSRCRTDFNKIWAEVYAKNYHKSLDHRSFYFKQQDTKNLSAKALLTEIREINEWKRKDDEVLLAVAAENRRPVVPNMEFIYEDPEVHEDLYKIMKYSCGEICSSDQADKAMKIWTTFLEPMLGVHSRHPGAERRDVIKAKGRSVKNRMTGTSKNNVTERTNANGAAIHLHADGSAAEKASPFRTRLSNGAEDVGNGAHDINHAPQKGGKLGVAAPRGRVQASALLPDEISEATTQLSSVERAVDLTSGDHPDDAMVDSQVFTQPPIKGVDCLRLLASANAERVGESIKVEREEGELSPTADFEDNFVTLEDGSVNVASESKDGLAGNQQQCKTGVIVSHTEISGENYVDADDEGEGSAERSNEDSEDASEAGNNASGSESGDAEECSHEEHEEDEDLDHDDQDKKTESEEDVEEVAGAQASEGGFVSFTFLDRSCHKLRPLVKHVPAALQVQGDKASRIFYGTDSFYVLFRLHQILYERVLSAKTHSSMAGGKWKASTEMNLADPYTKFLSAFNNLLDGSSDNTKFEDDCRTLIGTQSYVLFTLDKLIYKIVKQLQSIASDEMDSKVLQLYSYEKSRGPRGFIDLVYHENARILLHDESIYRFECRSNPITLSIQLMEYGREKPEVTAVSLEPNFSSYLLNDFFSSSVHVEDIDGVFLRRNKKKYFRDDKDSSCPATLDGIHVINGLECKISCKTSKVSYVLDTEDYLLRMKRRRVSLAECTSLDKTHLENVYAAKVQRFYRFLSRSQDFAP